MWEKKDVSVQLLVPSDIKHYNVSNHRPGRKKIMIVFLQRFSTLIYGR